MPRIKWDKDTNSRLILRIKIHIFIRKNMKQSRTYLIVVLIMKNTL